MEKTPGFVLGVFSFWIAATACAQPQLAIDLFEEGDGPGSRREGLRVLSTNPSNETIRTLMKKLDVRQTPETTQPPTTTKGKYGEWTVSFYRHVIRPAIGSRCSLSPSCSGYFLQASRRHGWLALPMIADRLVREPSVVAQHEREVQMHGETRIADPLSDHDGWLK